MTNLLIQVARSLKYSYRLPTLQPRSTVLLKPIPNATLRILCLKVVPLE